MLSTQPQYTLCSTRICADATPRTAAIYRGTANLQCRCATLQFTIPSALDVAFLAAACAPQTSGTFFAWPRLPSIHVHPTHAPGSAPQRVHSSCGCAANTIDSWGEGGSSHSALALHLHGRHFLKRMCRSLNAALCSYAGCAICGTTTTLLNAHTHACHCVSDLVNRHFHSAYGNLEAVPL